MQRIPVSKLPFDTLLGNLTFDIPESYDWPVVKCQKPAKLEITDKIEDGQRFYTHKLTFRTCREDLDMSGNYAYLVTTIEGKRYLIGNRERPYPIINMSDSTLIPLGLLPCSNTRFCGGAPEKHR